MRIGDERQLSGEPGAVRLGFPMCRITF